METAYGQLWNNYVTHENINSRLVLWDNELAPYTEDECRAATKLLKGNFSDYFPKVFQFAELCDTVRKNARPFESLKLIEEKRIKPEKSITQMQQDFEEMSLQEKLEYLPEDLHHLHVDENGEEIKHG